jgi:type IV secretion system protein VirB8
MFGKSKQQDASSGDAAKSPRSVNFEISIADLARRSEKRAWMVTSAAIVMSLILAGGYFYMLPLKKIEPYMIMADAYSGSAYVTKLEGDYNFRNLSTQEAVQKSYVARYVMARESFDFDVTRRDWDVVHLMSERNVSDSFSRMHDSANPQAPARLFGRDRALRVKVQSIRPEANPRQSGEETIYTFAAEYQRSIYEKRTGQERMLDNKTALIEFVFKNNLGMTDAQRYDNPLGFRVISYRVDNDASGAFPVAPPPTTLLPSDPNALTAPGQLPVQALPGQVAPGQLAPGQVAPGQVAPGQVPQGQIAPGQVAPGQVAPGQALPAQPAVAQPAVAQPAPAQPAGIR